ncbi:hypothetical protein [Streptomyces sp. NPDC017448]|uniref:hypothetical protein n=1 Tax=Streptomyces sp. NPDC017448 TaxID=3364996 RepID=UPI0037A89BBA
MPREMAGAAADGAFKAVLAVVFVAGAAPLGELLGVPVWLMAVSGVALLVGGAVGIGYLRSRPMSTYLKLMIGYDACWALAAAIGLLMAWRGSAAGGEVWMGYQVIAPLVFAAVLMAAKPARLPSQARRDTPA